MVQTEPAHCGGEYVVVMLAFFVDHLRYSTLLPPYKIFQLSDQDGAVGLEPSSIDGVDEFAEQEGPRPLGGEPSFFVCAVLDYRTFVVVADHAMMIVEAH